ncbi:MAG: ATP-binding protein [Pedococcus sp.]
MTTADLWGPWSRLPRQPREVGVGVGLLTVVFVLMLGSVELAPQGSTLASWWPAAGVSAGGVLLARGRQRAAMLAGVWLVAFLANVVGGRTPAAAGGFAFANTAECAVLVLLLFWFGGPGRSLRTMQDFWRMVLASVAGAVVAGGLGGLSAAVVMDAPFVVVGRSIAASHLAALLVIMPLFLRTVPAERRRSWELAVQWASVLVGTCVVFGLTRGMPVASVVTPLLVWGALRNSLRTTSAQLLVLGVLASLFTANGSGPFALNAAGATVAPETVAALVQGFLAISAFTLLPLSVTVMQRRELLARVSESEKVFRHGFADAMLGMFILRCEDSRPVAVEVNDVAARLLRQDRGALVSDGDWLEHFLEPGRAEVRNGMLAIMADTTNGWRGEVQLAQDHSRWVELVLSPVNRRGAHFMFTAQLVDTTEQHGARKLLEAALHKERDAVRELQRLNDAKSTFVSSVSHELRTPVTSVVGYSEMLIDGMAGEVSPDQQDMLGRIRRNGQRLMILVEDLLTASRLESGAASPVLRGHDLRDTAKGALEGVSPMLHNRRLRMNLEVGGQATPVLADAEQLERLVMNLLSNAIKFTPDDGSVTVKVSHSGTHALLSVSDTGMGIPEDEQDQLFSRFFRSSSAQRQAIQGTGIGLSIVRGIASQHGGAVSAASVEGFGSTFTLNLPLHDPAAVDSGSL